MWNQCVEKWWTWGGSNSRPRGCNWACIAGARSIGTCPRARPTRTTSRRCRRSRGRSWTTCSRSPGRSDRGRPGPLPGRRSVTCSTFPVSWRIGGRPVAKWTASGEMMRVASGLMTASTSAPCRRSSRMILGNLHGHNQPPDPHEDMPALEEVGRTSPDEFGSGCIGSPAEYGPRSLLARPGRPVSGLMRGHRSTTPWFLARRRPTTPRDHLLTPRLLRPSHGSLRCFLQRASSPRSAAGCRRPGSNAAPRGRTRGRGVRPRWDDPRRPEPHQYGRFRRAEKSFGTPPDEGRIHYLATTGMPFEAQLSQLYPVAPAELRASAARTFHERKVTEAYAPRRSPSPRFRSC